MNKLQKLLPEAWRTPELLSILASPQFEAFIPTLTELESSDNLRPKMSNIFKALELTKPEDVKVIILGQDPYPKPNDAMGLSFAVNPNQPIPRSLKNIYKEMFDDIGVDNTEANGDLTPWANQGVLLLNTTLTTIKGQSNVHAQSPWQTLTTAIIQMLNAQASPKHPIIIMLWGNDAKAKIPLISNNNMRIIQSSHPSPFSARYSFFGSKPFSQANTILTQANQKPINWELTKNTSEKE